MSRGETITLRRAWEDYKSIRKLKPVTLRGYEQKLNLCFSDWLDLSIKKITKDSVEERHQELSQKRSTRGSGTAQANLAMRILRDILKFAQHKYLDSRGNSILPVNPVHRLSEVRAWNRIGRRKNYIQPDQMKHWFEAVLGLKNTVLRDYLVFTLLTGLRRGEAAKIKWEHVDIEGGVVEIVDTKNHENFLLPLSDYAHQILKMRKQIAQNEMYVFPGSKSGSHIGYWNKTIGKAASSSGVKFMVHDLRRTFLTIGDSLSIPRELLKKLVNHKSNDVTDGYIIMAVERLRAQTQRITDEILRQASIRTKEGRAEAIATVNQPALATSALETSDAACICCGRRTSDFPPWMKDKMRNLGIKSFREWSSQSSPVFKTLWSMVAPTPIELEMLAVPLAIASALNISFDELALHFKGFQSSLKAAFKDYDAGGEGNFFDENVSA